MKKIIPVILFNLLLLRCEFAFAQMDSIVSQSVWRTFKVHLPSNYDAKKQYPLVINLHGLNSNATQQELLSQFNNVANTHQFIVVYPNAKGGSWVINTNSDVDFISQLIDTVRKNYSCNTCLFAMGMSQGGFLTYKLACSLPQKLKAIGVVSGNISQNLQNNCTISGGLPILHFHGTSDPLVGFNGTIGIPSVPNTINWLVNQNKCNTTPTITNLPNTNMADSTTAESYSYSNGTNGSSVTFYKINKGGHTWPGGIPIPIFGFTSMDINASELMGTFFSKHCTSANHLSIVIKENISAFPNPFTSRISIKNATGSEIYTLHTMLGKRVFTGENIEQQDFSLFAQGIYALTVKNATGQHIILVTKY